MPRVRIAAAAALLGCSLASAALAQAVTCPQSKSGPPSVDTHFYNDTIISTTVGLKPAPLNYDPNNPGLCIDSAGGGSHHRSRHGANAGGNIHLYLADAAYDWITFTIDPSLGAFDTNDARHAFTAPGQRMCDDNRVPDGKTLTVCLTSMGHNQYFPYFMRYRDQNGNKQKIEPGVQNH